MNIKIKMYLLTMVTFLGTINPAISYSGILIPTDNLGVTKDVKITDTNKLFKELENYESYRPDSYSDAVRNPFGEKRYKNLKIYNWELELNSLVNFLIIEE